MKRKSLLVICLVTVLTLSLVVACAKPAPAPAPTPTPAPAPAPAPITLTFDTFMPGASPHHAIDQEFWDGLEKATGGQVKTQHNLGAVMGSPAGTYDRVKSGVADAGLILIGYTPAVFPIYEVFLQPIYGDSHLTVVKATLEMYKKGYFDKDFTEIVPISFSTATVYVLYSNEKFTTVDQLKGKKLRGAGEVWAAVSEAVGAVGVTMLTAEVYGSFQTGILDGAWWVWAATTNEKVNEVVKYALPVNLTSFAHVTGMNKATWDKLPDAAKAYITNNREDYSLKLGSAYDADVVAAQKTFLATSPDHELTAWAPGEIDKLHQVLGPVWDVWITRTEGKGLPAKKAAAELWNIMKGLGVERPFIGYTP